MKAENKLKQDRENLYYILTKEYTRNFLIRIMIIVIYLKIIN